MAAPQRKPARDRRQQVIAAEIPRIRIVSGELVAEIIFDRRTRPPIVHCVVQKEGSPDILLLEQFHTQEEAERAAEHFIATYHAAKPKSAA